MTALDTPESAIAGSSRSLTVQFEPDMGGEGRDRFQVWPWNPVLNGVEGRFPGEVDLWSQCFTTKAVERL